MPGRIFRRYFSAPPNQIMSNGNHIKFTLQNNAFFKRLSAFSRRGLGSPAVKKSIPFLVYAQPLLLALLTYAVISRFAPIGVDAHHDGLLFKPALDVAEGKMLFRDTFTQYGALTTLLQASALKIFGRYLLVIRLQTAFLYALTAYFLWLIWKRLIPQWLATVCGLIYIFMAPYFLDRYFTDITPNFGWWFLPWSSVYALFFQVLSLYLLILFIEKRSRRYLAAAGASVALTMWAKQNVGALLFCAMSFFLVCLPLFTKASWKKFLADAKFFAAGFFAVNAFFAVWLALNHAFKDMWLQSVEFALLWRKHVVGTWSLHAILSSFFPGPLAFSSTPSYVWRTLPVACLILFVRTFLNYLWRGPLDTKQLVIFASVLVCLASWGQYYPVLCERHTYWASAPMIGVFAFFVWDLVKNQFYVYRAAVALLAIALLFQADITRRIQGGAAKLGHEYVALEYPEILKGMKVPAYDALFLQRIASDIDDYFKIYPEGGVINYNMDALFPAFVENLSNFHPLYVSWPNVELETLYQDYRAKFEKYAAEKKPIIISHTRPVIYAGYTIRSFGRDIYVTSPGDPESAWYITAFKSIQREYPEPAAPVRNYSLELQYAGKEAAAVRSIVVAAYDFNGTITATWRPVSQSTNSIALSYAASPAADMFKPLPVRFVIPADRKIQLLLTGHDFPHYSTARYVKVLGALGSGVRFQQGLSFLPLCGETAVAGKN